MAEKKSNAVLAAAFATALGVGLVLGATTGYAAPGQNNNGQEGHRVEHTWIKGEWTDDLLFGLLARDFETP